jgi:hypothetical protein
LKTGAQLLPLFHQLLDPFITAEVVVAAEEPNEKKNKKKKKKGGKDENFLFNQAANVIGNASQLLVNSDIL